jgi:N-acetylglucosaminyl-diphospho-decaprenol L-rhamnosyltransferase
VSAQVAVAVVSWNTRGLLRACLRSLAPEAEAGRAEVWVVDNASSDGSPDLVREEFGWARLVDSNENLGFGRAVNLVADRTTAPWIAPANADVALEPGALDALLATGESDPRAGAVAPRLVLPDGSTQHSVYAFPTLAFTFAFNAGAGRLGPRVADRLCLEGGWDPERPRTVDWAIGAFLVVRRRAWDEVGGFDPAQWMYAEDLDLGWRLARAGWRTRYEPRARVRHEASAAAEQAFGAERRERWMAATYAWMAARRGTPVAWAAALANLGGAGVRGALAAARRDAAGRAEMAAWARIHRRGLRSRARLLAER